MIDWDDVDRASRYDLHDWVVEIGSLVQDKIKRIKMGIYSEEHDGSLLEVLEEIEGMIR